jgi:hypothetical protein
VKAKPFSQPPLDKVSGHRIPETLLNNHPQAMVREFIINKIYPEMGTSKTSTGFLHPQKVRGRPQPFVRSEAVHSPQDIPSLKGECGRCHNHGLDHTLRRLRPLARRRFNTALPDFVDILSKNP